MKKGFTLIELLVVISIIAILASLALVSFTGAQKQGRDTTRRSDLQQYRNALEAYAAANNGDYPNYTTEAVISGSNLCQATVLYPFLNNVCLTDPKPGQSVCGTVETCGYRYAGSSVNQEYVLSAPLESGGWWVICSTGRAGKNTGNPGSSTCPTTGW